MSKVYPCVYCTEDGHCTKYSDDKVTSWCVQHPCEDEKPSNADRIRAMSGEELAEFLTEYRCVHKAPHCREANCTQCWLDWLKEPAEEV